MAPERRLAFGEVAELYDQARPSYPSRLVDDVVAFAGAGRGAHVLEIGAGTGKATELFAAHGLRILGLEPSPEMARVARRRLAAYARVKIACSDLESWRPAGRQFRLAYAAQAWHWVRPELGYGRVASALVSGGALAVFWNRARWDEVQMRAQLQEVYERVAPDLTIGAGPLHPQRGSVTRFGTDWDRDLGARAGFGAPEARDYDWSLSYSTAAYVALLQTHSDHRVLPPERRQALLEAVAQVLDGNGGRIEMRYRTRLLMARLQSPRRVAFGGERSGDHGAPPRHRRR